MRVLRESDSVGFTDCNLPNIRKFSRSISFCCRKRLIEEADCGRTTGALRCETLFPFACMIPLRRRWFSASIFRTVSLLNVMFLRGSVPMTTLGGFANIRELRVVRRVVAECFDAARDDVKD
jgi:hypothetical protein